MSDPILWHRLQFAFTITFHYLFPQLTMGLALLIVVLKGVALRTGSERWHEAARVWIPIFGLTFTVGVVTGIPMEFQFGTNWAAFSRYAGGVIGHTLAMEGLFAFFLESTFLGLLIFGERRLGRRGHYFAALAVWAGSWLSGYFIVATNAFMQHPVGHTLLEGVLVLDQPFQFLFNPWAIVQYLHTMMASVVTAAFVVSAVGAFYFLRGQHQEQARLFLKWGTRVGLVASLLVAFPTGDRQAKLVAESQPVTLAAMEGRFESGENAELTFIGQPNVRERRIDNAIQAPMVLSILAYGTPKRSVLGLNEFPVDTWPTNIELLYYSFHVMAGLGTLFILLMAISSWLGFRGVLEQTRPVLWTLMLAFPFPYIATTAG